MVLRVRFEPIKVVALMCEEGPAVVIYPDNIWYTKVEVQDVDEIFETSILNDGVVKKLSCDND